MTPRPLRSHSPSLVLRIFASVFTAPFRGLPWLIWCYFVWCFLVYPHSAVLQGELPDTDDYMYLDQITDWLKGQGWFDNIQHRLDPPHGTFIAFSRITEIPYAGITWLFSRVTSLPKAALAMAAIVPPVLFGFLLSSLNWLAQPFTGPYWSRLTAYVVLFASYLIFQFSPGHIDHHGLTALLVITGFGFTVRMIKAPAEVFWPIGAGLIFSLALVVGLEVLPPLILTAAWLGLWAMVNGGKPSRSSCIFGVSLFLGCLFFLSVTSSTSDLWTLDPLRYSAVYVLLAAGIAFCLAGVALTSLIPFPAARYAAGISLPVVSGLLYLLAFPALVTGPLGAMNPELARVMFSSITESLPAIKLAPNGVAVFLYVLWPLMGVVAAAVCWRRAAKEVDYWLWGMSLFLLAANFLLGTFYQIRFMVFAQLFCVIPLTMILRDSIDWIEGNLRGRAIGLMEIGVLLMVGPLPMVILPSAVDGAPFNTGILLFPVSTADYECDMKSLVRELNRDDFRSTHSDLLMNEMESGPELLFRTRYSVLGAPYHTNVTGNLDAAQFFGSVMGRDNGAKALLTKRGADVVVLCRKVVPLYKDQDSGRSLAERLNDGDVPPWLRQLHYPGEGDYLLFEAKPSSAP